MLIKKYQGYIVVKIGDKWMDYEPSVNKHIWFSKYKCSKCGYINNFNQLEDVGCIVCDDKYILNKKLEEIVKEIEPYIKNRLTRIYLSIKDNLCSMWEDNINSFIVWSMSSGYRDYLTIKLIDDKYKHSPVNSKWTYGNKHKKQKKLLSTNTSGYRGVSFNKRVGKYISRIYTDRISICIGYYDTPLLAAMARDKYIINNKLKHKLAFNNKKRRKTK